jgi:hypothetical protein
MSWRGRSFWLALVLVLYLCAAHLRVAPRSPYAWAGVVLGTLVLWFGWQRASSPPLGADWIDPRARSAGKLVALGAALAAVVELAPASAGFAIARVLGIGLAATGATVALSRIASLGAARGTPQPSWDAPVATALLWLVSLGLSIAEELVPSEVDALTVDYAVVAAGLGSMGISMVTAWRVYATRRFDLGVPERAAGALWLAVVCLAVGTIAALMEVARPERIVPVCALLEAIAAAACALSQNPGVVSSVLRHVASATMLATPLMCVSVVVAYKAPTHAGLILFVVTATAVALGMCVARIADRLAPERGRWLRVMEAAIAAAKAPEPRQAVTLALCAIRDGLGPAEGPAALYRFSSGDRLVVDRADYLHVEDAQVPGELIDRAMQEAERVVSIEALRWFEVRDQRARSLVAWLDARASGAAALVFDEDVPVGLLTWPAAGRVLPLAYQEITALRRLADHLGVATGADAQLARSRARELAAEQGIGRAEGELRALTDMIARQGIKQRAFAEMLARRARVAAYSPAAQSALTTAERLGAQGKPIALVVQPGMDALAWAAVVHLASARSDEMMLVIDATLAEEQPIERYNDKMRSPLELAAKGTLVLIDAHALPKPTQRYIGTALADDTGLIALLPTTADAMVARGDLDEHLADRLGDRSVVLPTLHARAEDLRALSLHMLSRIGMRLRGRPFGLSLDAQQLLGDEPWVANEAELEAVLVRAALMTEGDVVGKLEVSRALRGSDARAEDSGRIRVAGKR